MLILTIFFTFYPRRVVSVSEKAPGITDKAFSIIHEAPRMAYKGWEY